MGRVELRGISQKDEFLRRVKEAVRSQFPAFYDFLNFVYYLWTLELSWLAVLFFVFLNYDYVFQIV